jgi:hypothetical protein
MGTKESLILRYNSLTEKTKNGVFSDQDKIEYVSIFQGFQSLGDIPDEIKRSSLRKVMGIDSSHL